MKSIKLSSTTSGEISPTTNKIVNLLFSSFKGIRDDLEFPLEENLSSINLCTLHCELLEIPEQLLSSLGLSLYKVGSLDECNAELANYGPENFNSRITVKMKEGQETTCWKAKHPGVFIFRYLLSCFIFVMINCFYSLYPFQGFYFCAVPSILFHLIAFIRFIHFRT